VSVGGAVVLLATPAAYTYVILTNAPDEIWAWGHQFVATFFSVGFALAIGFWLYLWQTRSSDSN
jgi:hypothetical protein